MFRCLYVHSGARPNNGRKLPSWVDAEPQTEAQKNTAQLCETKIYSKRVEMHTQSFLFLALLAVSWGQVVIQDLTVNTAAHGVAHLEQWNFYKFIVLGNNGFVLKASHASKHDLDIYISKAGGSLPGYVYFLIWIHSQTQTLLVQRHQFQSQHHH